MGVHSPDDRVPYGYIPVSPGLLLGRAELDRDHAHRRIDDPRMSREHARFVAAPAEPSGLAIADCRSRNGTFVDGVRVETRGLRPGMIVRTGDTLFEFGPLDADRAPALEDPELTGRSAAFREVLARIARVAGAEVAVLLSGETGTGKEVVARRLHAASGRRGTLVAVNCAAIPTHLMESALFGHRRGAFTGASSDAQGFLEEARTGTLFLDEVGELTLPQQAKLLRVLENREATPVGASRPIATDVRVIAATNADLHQQIALGLFRNDLYARLAGAVIELPALRARRSDIPLLARRFLAERAPARRVSLSASAIERLLLLPWPRNIRQLRSVIDELLLQHPGEVEFGSREVELVAGVRAVPSSSAAEPAKDPWARPDRSELVAALERFRGNVSRIAGHYRKDGKQIYRWLRHHGLHPERYRVVR